MKERWGILAAGVIVIIFAYSLFSKGGFDGGDVNSAIDTDTTTPTSTTMKQYPSAPAMMLEDGVDYKALLKTTKGEITIDLYETQTPITVNNFVFLAQDGYYENVPIHRIIKNFMIQTGDPTGTGRGNPGYQFEDELFEGEYTRGVVAMANAGPDTNGSQFFIMHQDFALQKNYVIFGQVVEGIEVVDALADTPVQANQFGEMSIPTEKVFIESVEITKA